MTTQEWNAWNFRDRPEMVPDGRDMVGFEIHAADGHFGKIDEATTEVDKSRVVVDTGPWIFGRKILLPAGVIERVDWIEERVYVDLDKDQIKDSPELEGSSDDPVFGERLATYYGNLYAGRANAMGAYRHMS
jgi:hypothetical protein